MNGYIHSEENTLADFLGHKNLTVQASSCLLRRWRPNDTIGQMFQCVRVLPVVRTNLRCSDLIAYVNSLNALDLIYWGSCQQK